MTILQVERQFRAYKKLTNEGKKGALNDFSKDTAASKVMTHMQSIRRFSDKRWASIYALCGAEQRVASDVDEDAMDDLLLRHGRWDRVRLKRGDERAHEVGRDHRRCRLRRDTVLQTPFHLKKRL